MSMSMDFASKYSPLTRTFPPGASRVTVTPLSPGFTFLPSAPHSIHLIVKGGLQHELLPCVCLEHEVSGNDHYNKGYPEHYQTGCCTEGNKCEDDTSNQAYRSAYTCNGHARDKHKLDDEKQQSRKIRKIISPSDICYSLNYDCIKVKFLQPEAHILQRDCITHFYHTSSLVMCQLCALFSLYLIMTAYIDK